MPKRTVFAFAVSAVVAASAGVASAAPSQTGITHRNVHVCGTPAAGFASCDAVRHDTLRDGQPDATSGPSGYNPTDLRSAYNLPSATAGASQTVAIVDAYDDPTAEADLNVYRGQFGIPACTTANGCFRKVNQTGGSTPPKADGGWGQEISLDLDMVSAICPKCKIVLIEA